MKYYTGVHTHGQGTSVYLFKTNDVMYVDDFADYLGEEYEPDREEFLDLEESKPELWVSPRNEASMAEEPEQGEEHPDFPRSDWVYAVTNGDTDSGYQDYVSRCLEEREFDKENTGALKPGI